MKNNHEEEVQATKEVAEIIGLLTLQVDLYLPKVDLKYLKEKLVKMEDQIGWSEAAMAINRKEPIEFDVKRKKIAYTKAIIKLFEERQELINLIKEERNYFSARDKLDNLFS